jgi:hypothetical protein
VEVKKHTTMPSSHGPCSTAIGKKNFQERYVLMKRRSPSCNGPMSQMIGSAPTVHFEEVLKMEFSDLVVDEVVKDNYCTDHKPGSQELEGISALMLTESKKGKYGE